MRPRRKAPVRQPKKAQSSESWSRLLVLFVSAGLLFWLMATRSEKLSISSIANKVNSIRTGHAVKEAAPVTGVGEGNPDLGAASKFNDEVDAEDDVSSQRGGVIHGGGRQNRVTDVTKETRSEETKLEEAGQARKSDADELASVTAARVLEAQKASEEEEKRKAAEAEAAVADAVGAVAANAAGENGGSSAKSRGGGRGVGREAVARGRGRTVAVAETKRKTEVAGAEGAAATAAAGAKSELVVDTPVSTAAPPKPRVQKRRRRRRRGPNAKWTPVNGSFPLVLGRPRRRRLTVNIVKDSLTRVYLDANRFGVDDPEPELPPLEASKGGVCPEFEYGYEGYQGIASCWKSPIEDFMDTPTMFPANCPKMEKSCIHETDSQPHKKWAAQVLLLHNVYVNVAGQVFNQTHFFDHNACTANQPFHHAAGKTRVFRYKELVSVVDWFAWNARANLLDILPLFVALDQVLPYMKGIPVAFGHRLTHAQNQMDHMVALGSSEVLGVRLERLNPQILSDNDLFFAEKLILPLHQRCGRPSRAMWHYLRTRHFLPTGGLPLYRHGASFHSTYRRRRGAAVEDFNPGPEWVVLLGMKEERKPLVETLRLQQQLMRYFPSERIQIYREGSLSFSKRKALLNRAILLISVHDNLLADMVFLPPGAAVFELRLVDDHDPTFHHLAEACGLEYYLMFAEGARGTSRRPAKMHVKDPKKVHSLIKVIAKKVKAKWA